VTDRSNKPSQRRPGGITGHVRPEQPVTIAGIRTIDGGSSQKPCQDPERTFSALEDRDRALYDLRTS